jgi:hypothetical protein
MVVRSEFARKLERERDEAREALAELRASVLDLSHPNIKMILSERDEAREALRTGGMLNIIDRAHHERAAAIRERDEAREEAAMWKSNHDNQAALKSMLMERPDLGDRASRIAELISERDRLAEAVNAATILIAARGRHNTMLAYEGLRDTLQSLKQSTEP